MSSPIYDYENGNITKDGFTMGPSNIIRQLNRCEHNRQEVLRLGEALEDNNICTRCLVSMLRCECGEGG